MTGTVKKSKCKAAIISTLIFRISLF